MQEITTHFWDTQRQSNQTFEIVIALPARILEAVLKLLEVITAELLIIATGGFRGPVLPIQGGASRRLDLSNAEAGA